MVSGRFGNAFSHCLIQFACKDSVSNVARPFKVLQFSHFWKSYAPVIFFQFSIGVRALGNALEQLSLGKKLFGVFKGTS